MFSWWAFLVLGFWLAESAVPVRFLRLFQFLRLFLAGSLAFRYYFCRVAIIFSLQFLRASVPLVMLLSFVCILPP